MYIRILKPTYMSLFPTREHKYKIRELEQSYDHLQKNLGQEYSHRRRTLDQEHEAKRAELEASFTTRKLEVDQKLQDYREHQLTEQSKIGVQTNQKILDMERKLAEAKEKLMAEMEEENLKLVKLTAEAKGLETELNLKRQQAALGLGSWDVIKTSMEKEILGLQTIIAKMLEKETTNVIVPTYVTNGKPKD